MLPQFFSLFRSTDRPHFLHYTNATFILTHFIISSSITPSHRYISNLLYACRDGLIGILIIYSICVNPMQLAWESLQSPGLTAMEYVLDLLFAGDIIASFNTAYFSEKDDAFMTQRSRINTVRGSPTLHLQSTPAYIIILVIIFPCNDYPSIAMSTLAHINTAS